MNFHTTLHRSGKNTTGIIVPDEVIEALGGGARPPVRVTINGGHSYGSTVARRGGDYMVGVSAENRELAGVAGGDAIDVEIELDTSSREVTVPSDLAAAIAGEPDAQRFFDGLTPTQRGYFVTDVESAKKPETRRRRIAKAVEMLREGRKR
jgi:hypothetical protein